MTTPTNADNMANTPVAITALAAVLRRPRLLILFFGCSWVVLLLASTLDDAWRRSVLPHPTLAELALQVGAWGFFWVNVWLAASVVGNLASASAQPPLIQDHPRLLAFGLMLLGYIGGTIGEAIFASQLLRLPTTWINSTGATAAWGVLILGSLAILLTFLFFILCLWWAMTRSRWRVRQQDA